jgi:enterochelin esterase family protein
MPHNSDVVEFVPADVTDGQVGEAEEWAEFLALNISSRDKLAYALTVDETSDYRLSADSLPQAGVPAGRFFRLRWTSDAVYPGVERNVWLYVPHAVAEGEKVNLLVCQDGPSYFGPQVNATAVLDNLTTASYSTLRLSEPP